VEQINGLNVLVKQVDGMDNQTMRAILDQLKSNLDSAVIVLYSLQDNKLNVIAGLSKNSLGKAPSAAVLVKHLCGKGGGREDMAQGGGPIPADLKEKVKQIRTMLQ
jgi:alanyl-tRNA synthetase